jgi:predicted O-methyltransferase YrrM
MKFLEEIPKPILDRMKELEAIDARDRTDGTPMLQRLRQVPPETGMLLAILAASAPEGDVLEIGASAGYSALWLSLAGAERGKPLVTFELLPEKAELARATFEQAKVGAFVEFVHGDARGHVADYEKIAFCFLDAEKEMYEDLYNLIVPNIVKGGLLVADNVISHEEDLKKFVEKVGKDKAVDSVILPVGKGLLVCRKK